MIKLKQNNRTISGGQDKKAKHTAGNGEDANPPADQVTAATQPKETKKNCCLVRKTRTAPISHDVHPHRRYVFKKTSFVSDWLTLIGSLALIITSFDS